jgi:hypothetical protein
VVVMHLIIAMVLLAFLIVANIIVVLLFTASDVKNILIILMSVVSANHSIVRHVVLNKR